MPITPDTELLAALEAGLPDSTRARLEMAVQRMVTAKQRGQKIAVVTGSGPNVHEGVTTLLAELMRVGLVDGVAGGCKAPTGAAGAAGDGAGAGGASTAMLRLAQGAVNPR